MSDKASKKAAPTQEHGLGEQVSRVPLYNNLTRMTTGKAPKALGKVASPLALYGGATNLGEGLGKMASGDVADGSVQALGGAGAATAGAIGTTHALATLAGPQAAGLAAATAPATLGTAVGAAGAAPIAATVGAGLATGVAIGNRGNSYIADTGLLGQNADGSGRSWSDWAGDTGFSAYEATKDSGAPEWVAQTAGFGATLGASAVATLPAAVTGIAGLATDAAEFMTSW